MKSSTEQQPSKFSALKPDTLSATWGPFYICDMDPMPYTADESWSKRARSSRNEKTGHTGCIEGNSSAQREQKQCGVITLYEAELEEHSPWRPLPPHDEAEGRANQRREDELHRCH